MGPSPALHLSNRPTLKASLDGRPSPGRIGVLENWKNGTPSPSLHLLNCHTLNLSISPSLQDPNSLENCAYGGPGLQILGAAVNLRIGQVENVRNNRWVAPSPSLHFSIYPILQAGVKASLPNGKVIEFNKLNMEGHPPPSRHLYLSTSPSLGPSKTQHIWI